MVPDYEVDNLNRIGSTQTATIQDRSAEGGVEDMPKKKPTVRKPWTKEDLRQLKVHSKKKTPAAEVAKAMKRTEAAVRQKATTIGIGLGHRR